MQPARYLPTFAVVIPAYNEENGIADCVNAVDAELEHLPHCTSLIVVDDGSADSTVALLRELEQRFPRLIVEAHAANRGYGAALRTGTLIAAERGFDYVLFMDADLTNDPGYLRDFARRMEEGADVIKASRYSPGGGVRGVPFWRVALSVIGNTVARALYRLPVRDATNGFRAVRTKLLTSVELHENGFAVIMEELHRIAPSARAYAEVPIVLTDRAAGLRGSTFDYRPRALARYLKYPVLEAVRRLSPHRR